VTRGQGEGDLQVPLANDRNSYHVDSIHSTQVHHPVPHNNKTRSCSKYYLASILLVLKERISSVSPAPWETRLSTTCLHWKNNLNPSMPRSSNQPKSESGRDHLHTRRRGVLIHEDPFHLQTLSNARGPPRRSLASKNGRVSAHGSQKRSANISAKSSSSERGNYKQSPQHKGFMMPLSSITMQFRNGAGSGARLTVGSGVYEASTIGSRAR
jgi:hypothetical protein